MTQAPQLMHPATYAAQSAASTPLGLVDDHMATGVMSRRRCTTTRVEKATQGRRLDWREGGPWTRACLVASQPAEIGVTALGRTALAAWQEQPAAIWVAVGDVMGRCSCGWVGRWSTPRLGLVSAGP